MTSEWISIQKDEAHVRRERQAARELKKSMWWKQRLTDGRCHHCGKTFSSQDLTLDHLVPVARGGRSTKGNCVPSCKSCNSSKAYLTPAELILNHLRAERQNPQD